MEVEAVEKPAKQKVQPYALQRSDERRRLHGLVCKGTFFLNQHLRQLTDETTVYSINAELKQCRDRVEGRYGGIVMTGYRFAIPEKEFNLPRLRIELLYGEDVVLESCMLAFVVDPDDVRDDRATVEKSVSCFSGHNYAMLLAHTILNPTYRRVTEGLSQVDLHRLKEAFRFYELMVSEPPAQKVGYTLTLVPEHLSLDFHIANNPYRVSIGL